MKLTRNQLQTIIKEELDAVIEEGHGGMMAPKDVFFRVIMPALESAGFMGLDAMKMAKDAVDAAFGMGRDDGTDARRRHAMERYHDSRI